MTKNAEQDLIEDLAGFHDDPYEFVLYSFPWGEGDLAGRKLENWQKNELIWLTGQLKSQKTNKVHAIDHAIKSAKASGHGIGKSAFIAWIILWALATREDTRGVVFANTESQLKTKTWAELKKWHNLFIAKHWFTFTDTAIFSSDANHKQSWRVDWGTWSENNTEAVAGLHNYGKRIIIIFDEASAIPAPVWDVMQGACSDANTEIIWLAFGNPTLTSGKFYDVFHSLRNIWRTEQIDARTVSLTNKTELEQQIKEHGEDSDFVRVRIKGEFPRASALQFISSELVEAARRRNLGIEKFGFAAKIIGVDPSWANDGDETAIYFRQGNYSKMLAVFPGMQDDFILAGHIAKFEDEEKVDAVMVDFGYGTGVVSAGRQLGRQWHLVEFGGASSVPAYLNKRAEMWGSMRDWLKAGAQIPDDPRLTEELCGPEAYVMQSGGSAGKIKLESKQEMKKRGVMSPNRADALACTFAMPVLPKNGMQSANYHPGRAVVLRRANRGKQ